MEEQLRFRYHRAGDASDLSSSFVYESNQIMVAGGSACHPNEPFEELIIHEESMIGDQTSLLEHKDCLETEVTVQDRLFDPDEFCPQTPTYCTGCTLTRLLMSPMVVMVLGLVGLTYYAYMFQTMDVNTAEIIFFHIFISLLLCSYFQCLSMDPGTVPQRWHDAVSVFPDRAKYKLCRRSLLYKPPRSHYDSITERLVLNMDHFCPWMVNCIGFYNRKFFLLFLFWTCVAVYQFVGAMLARVGGSVFLLLVDSDRGITMIKFMAFIVDAALGLAVPPFLGFHIKLVCCNQTTLESEETNYDVGWRRNVASVMGENPWLWLIPVYGRGPAGDGIHWPRAADLHRHSPPPPSPPPAAAAASFLGSTTPPLPVETRGGGGGGGGGGGDVEMGIMVAGGHRLDL